MIYEEYVRPKRLYMKRLLIIFILSITYHSAYTQGDDLIYYSEIISLNLEKYKENSNLAYQQNDVERARFLFDSLIQNVVVGTQLDEFKVSTLKIKSGAKKPLVTYEKPLFLLTYADWCIPDVGELPALNELAEKYHDQIDFVVLFWNKRSDVRKVAKNYNHHIELAYVDETDNQSSNVVNKLKHVFGLPTAIFVNQWGEIVDVQREVSNHYSETDTKSYEIHYNYIAKGISLLIAYLDGNPPVRKLDTNPAEVYDNTGYNQYGFDQDGFDENGFDEKGFDKKGFDRRGYDENGFDKEGYDESGFDINGIDKYAK